jgi:hypothetical protein
MRNQTSKITFPRELHEMLLTAKLNNQEDIVSWMPHGRAFRVHKPQEFVEQIMKKHFRQTKWASFLRQLHLYRFARLSRGPDKGAYYHPKFLFQHLDLASTMKFSRVTGTKVRLPANRELEPDFYNMPFLIKNEHKENCTTSIFDSNSNIFNEQEVSQLFKVEQQSWVDKNLQNSDSSSLLSFVSDDDSHLETDSEIQISSCFQSNDHAFTNQTPMVTKKSWSIPQRNNCHQFRQRYSEKLVSLMQGDFLAVANDQVQLQRILSDNSYEVVDVSEENGEWTSLMDSILDCDSFTKKQPISTTAA